MYRIIVEYITEKFHRKFYLFKLQLLFFDKFILKFNNTYVIVVKNKRRMWITLDGKLVRFTKLVLDIMFFSGIIVIITLPFSLKLLGKYYSNEINQYFLFMLVIFAFSGISGMVIIGQLRKMMRTVLEETCFVYGNVKSLNIMAAASVCICILFLLKLLVMPTPATAVIVLVFFIAALFSEVLAHVFYPGSQL